MHPRESSALLRFSQRFFTGESFNNTDMKRTFTLFMTRGAYVVGEADAHRVMEAITNGTPHVGVSADVVGDGLCVQPMQIVTAHVVSVSANAESATCAAGVSKTSRAAFALVKGGLA